MHYATIRFAALPLPGAQEKCKFSQQTRGDFATSAGTGTWPEGSWWRSWWSPSTGSKGAAARDNGGHPGHGGYGGHTPRSLSLCLSVSLTGHPVREARQSARENVRPSPRGGIGIRDEQLSTYRHRIMSRTGDGGLAKGRRMR